MTFSIYTNTEYVKRAIAAYFRLAAGSISPDYPSNESYETEHEGKKYVVLVNSNGILRVYRILGSGLLKGLKRWPKQIEP